MPLYLYNCMKCGAQREDMQQVADRHNGPPCDHCGRQMTLQLSPVYAVVKNPAAPKGTM